MFKKRYQENYSDSLCRPAESRLYEISRLIIATSNVLNRSKKRNEGTHWKGQFKPFNFFLLGFQEIKERDKAVKPMAPYTKDYQNIVFEPFIDYETGEVKEGSQHFKPLSARNEITCATY